MKLQQIPCFGKVGENWEMTKGCLKDRHNIVKDHLLTGAPWAGECLCRALLRRQQHILTVGKGIPFCQTDLTC